MERVMDMSDDVKQFRKLRRAELLAQRLAITKDQYRQWNDSITRLLVNGFPSLQQMTIGLYWPYKGEFDPRFAIREFRKGGAIAALPVVIQKAQPLQFREWWPGAPVTKGVFNLPNPEGTAVLQPNVLLIPPIGFDLKGYRLGYGGGFFDRTLASLTPQPLKIGVAFEISRMETIYPQPHDIPMDFIVTEAAIYKVSPEGLTPIREPEDCATVRGYSSPPCFAHELDPSYWG